MTAKKIAKLLMNIVFYFFILVAILYFVGIFNKNNDNIQTGLLYILIAIGYKTYNLLSKIYEKIND